MSSRHKFLIEHFPDNFIFDKTLLRVDTQYHNNQGWYIDVHLENNDDSNVIKVSIEGGQDLNEAIKMAMCDLVEEVCWSKIE